MRFGKRLRRPQTPNGSLIADSGVDSLDDTPSDDQPLPFAVVDEEQSTDLCRRLSRDDRSVRLLTLFPGAFNNGIKCIIHHASLDEKDLHYQTLCYVWGDKSIRTIVKVDGRDVAVTRNLGDALRYLRLAEKPLTLWVDAICINQDDLTEKMHQVELMQTIFSRCSQNFI
jgi:hypothetical protein